jgi:hypothetical protein
LRFGLILAAQQGSDKIVLESDNLMMQAADANRNAVYGDPNSACSLGLSATSQQYFSLRTNQPPATSHNQPAVLFSQNKPAPAISHQPTEQAVGMQGLLDLLSFWFVHRECSTCLCKFVLKLHL